MKRIRWTNLGILVVATMLSACGMLSREAPPPVSRVTVQDFDVGELRFLPFEEHDAIKASVEQAYLQESAESYDVGPSGDQDRRHQVVYAIIGLRRAHERSADAMKGRSTV